MRQRLEHLQSNSLQERKDEWERAIHSAIVGKQFVLRVFAKHSEALKNSEQVFVAAACGKDWSTREAVHRRSEATRRMER